MANNSVNTKDFNSIQDAVNKIDELGGGEVIVNEGIHETGPLNLCSNLTLRLEDGARIKFIADPTLYPPVWTRWEGVECYALHPLVFASNKENIKIIGSRTSPIREFTGSPNVYGSSNLSTQVSGDNSGIKLNDGSSDASETLDAEELLRSANDHLTPEQQKVADDAANVGTIDGNGWHWWELFRENQNSNQSEPKYDYEKRLAELNPGYKDQPGGGGRRETQYLRPPLMQFFSCKNIVVEGFNLMNSPFWTLHLVYCEDTLIKNMAIINPADAINTDAIDIDSCLNTKIVGCCLDCGDDAVTLKSGSGEDGLRVNKPTAGVEVEDVVVYASHGGIALGSETAGGLRDISAKNCEFIGTQRAIRLKSRRSRGGVLENILLEDLKMTNCWCPIVITVWFQPGVNTDDPKQAWILSLDPQPVDEFTPTIRNVTIRNVDAKNVRSTAALIAGLPEKPIADLEITNFNYTLADESELLPTWQTEMTGGHFHDDDRSIKIINANIKQG